MQDTKVSSGSPFYTQKTDMNKHTSLKTGILNKYSNKRTVPECTQGYKQACSHAVKLARIREGKGGDRESNLPQSRKLRPGW